MSGAPSRRVNDDLATAEIELLLEKLSEADAMLLKASLVLRDAWKRGLELQDALDRRKKARLEKA